MKRGITINLDNKTFYTLIAILSILVISGIAIATLNPDVPNPGHKISELQKCSDGETLVMVGGNWACSASVTGNIQSQWIATCPAGWTDTNLTDCDSGDGPAVDENSCDQGGGATRLCLKIG